MSARFPTTLRTTAQSGESWGRERWELLCRVRLSVFSGVCPAHSVAPWGRASAPSQAAGPPERCPSSAQIRSSSHLLQNFRAQCCRAAASLTWVPPPPSLPWGPGDLALCSLPRSLCCCLAFPPGVLFISVPSGSRQPPGPGRHYSLSFAFLSREACRTYVDIDGNQRWGTEASLEGGPVMLICPEACGNGSGSVAKRFRHTEPGILRY